MNGIFLLKQGIFTIDFIDYGFCGWKVKAPFESIYINRDFKKKYQELKHM